MCGIVGIWGDANETLAKKMTDCISHRGPDDWGIKAFEHNSCRVTLGHRRLSIIDLSPAGHQPMTNEDGTVWLTFNGEIYNFKPIRAELLSLGHQFKSNTDSEVLIHGYEEWGIGFVDKLNGIFAFALWDENKDELHLVRDRYGIKPLYYSEVNGKVFFGSEYKALLFDEGAARTVNSTVLLQYLTYRYTPEPETLLKNVHKVPPGSWMTFSTSGVTKKCFYELQFNTISKASEQELTKKLLEVLEKAVERQMMSDVPIGFFLSGGVDSTGLVALASKHTQEKIRTFTVGFRQEDQKFEAQPDDVRYAAEMAKHFNTEHHEIILEPKIIDLLPHVIYHLDDPIADPAAITSYLICEQAKNQNVKVLLSGQGGDEVFCGYPWHRASNIGKAWRNVPSPLRVPMEMGISRLPASKGGRLTGTFRRLRKFAAHGSLPFEEQLLGFLSYATKDNLYGLLGERFKDEIDSGVQNEVHYEILRRSQEWDSINRMLHLDMGTFLPSLNLTYTDKTSMAHSIEARVPYIDNEVVDFMSTVPPHLKMNGSRLKYLMKQSLKGVLPEEILNRKKAGFGAPIRSWIVGDLKDMVQDLLSESQIKKRGYFNPQYVQQLISDNSSGRHDYNYLIYILLSFELWHHAFVDSPA